MGTTQHLEVADGTLAFDDSGGEGPLVVMLPGAGDIRAEYRLLVPELVAAGARVVTADLRGHGDSTPDWPGYGVPETASDLVALLEHLDGGPALVVATSFAPAAALWAAADRPELVGGLVLISAHLETAPLHQRVLLGLLLRGPLAGRLWANQYRQWHRSSPPADLDEHATALAGMLTDRRRRRAVRQTLAARRDGLEPRMDRVTAPALVVMGGSDSHFGDPVAEGEAIAALTGGRLEMIPDAGHYPHAEFPQSVAQAIVELLAGIER